MGIRKTRRVARKGGGGGAPNTIHYKYTKDLKRGRWVDTIYPYGRLIMGVLPLLRWNAFRYEGPLIIETDGYEAEDIGDGDGGRGGFNLRATEGTTKLHKTAGHSIPVSGAPYEVFGGAACELWGLAVPEVPLHKFVDITGDIDIVVSVPAVVPEKASLRELIDNCGNDCLRPLLLHDGVYTHYGEAFTGWLFHEVVTQFSGLREEFNIPSLAAPGRDENAETVLGDLHVGVGNLLFSRLISEDKSMIKIQISTKVLPDIVNHIVEFVLSPDGGFRSKANFTVHGICVQGPVHLLQDQVDGLAGRADGVKNTMGHHGVAVAQDYPSFYKFDNHCARVLYLATLIKFVEGKRYIENGNIFMNMSIWQAVDILETLYKGGRGAMCDAHFGPSFIDKVIGIFESMEYIGAGQLSSELNPQFKKKLKKAIAV